MDTAIHIEPPIVFGGMHRSGTSFVASFARAAGIDLGQRLMDAAPGNEAGHFENLDFVEFHRRHLALAGIDEAGWVQSKALVLDESARREAEQIIRHNARAQAWGWKDPRTTLFLEFWISVAPNARFVFVYREPAEVVQSLFRRGDRSIRESSSLAIEAWLSHNRIILQFVRKHRTKCVLLNVAQVIETPSVLLNLLAQRFGAQIDINVASPYRTRLMHLEQRPSLPMLLRHFVPAAGALYDELEQEADNPRESATNGGMTTAAAFFDYWSEAFSGHREKSIEQLIDTIADLERAVQEAQVREAVLLDALEQQAGFS